MVMSCMALQLQEIRGFSKIQSQELSGYELRNGTDLGRRREESSNCGKQ